MELLVRNGHERMFTFSMNMEKMHKLRPDALVLFFKETWFKQIIRIEPQSTFNLLEIEARMGKSLVIVESPPKAKTIKKYLGENYIVKSSVGHIRDLPTSGGASSKNAMDPKERAKLAAAAKKGGKLGQRARLAITLGKMRKK